MPEGDCGALSPAGIGRGDRRQAEADAAGVALAPLLEVIAAVDERGDDAVCEAAPVVCDQARRRSAAA